METDASLFIGTIVVAITEAIRRLVPAVDGVVTIGVAAVVGLLVGVLDNVIGVVNVSPAEGLMIGLGAAGVVAVAKHSNSAPKTDY